MNERERALRNVQITTFALVEANLFLDSHPEDPAAIEYFQKYRTLLSALWPITNAISAR